MALFTLTINNLSPALDKQHQESERVHRYTESAMQDFHSGGGRRTSGNIVDGSTTVGSWTYTPQASS
jgi:hypothetical protein